MKKKRLVLTTAAICLAVLLSVLSVGVLYKPDKKQNFCMKGLTEQVKDAVGVYEVQVITNTPVGSGENTIQCTYRVKVIEELGVTSSDSLGKTFNIVQAYGGRPVGHSCTASGGMLLVILSGYSMLAETQTCASSAIIDIAVKSKLSNLLLQ